MTDIIRDAIIRIKLELARGGLDSSNLSGVTKAFEQQRAAAKSVQQQVEQNTLAAREYARATKDMGGPASAGGLTGHQSMLGRDYRQVRSEVEQAIKDQERLNEGTSEFGRRSSYSYGRGLMGITEFGRGLALLASNGGESSQQLMKSIIGIQGAVDLLRGAFQISRLGPEVGVIAAAVTAGTAAWMLYAEQVALAKKTISDLTKEYEKASKAESAFFAQRDKTTSAARFTATQDEQTPEGRRAARQNTIAAIQSERAEQEQQAQANSSRAFQNRRASEGNRSEASALPNGLFQGLLSGYSASQIGEAEARRKKLLEAADSQDKAAKEYGGRSATITQQELDQAQQEKQLLEQQRDEERQQLQERHRIQLDQLGGVPGKNPQDWLKRQQRLGASGASVGIFGAFGGIAGGAFAATDLSGGIQAQERIIQGEQRGRLHVRRRCHQIAGRSYQGQERGANDVPQIERGDCS